MISSTLAVILAQRRCDPDETRWYDYMVDSIIDPTLNKDVLELEPIRKPALLRALFELGASFSGQEISYRKILGQLDDKGNTETMRTTLICCRKRAC